MHGSMNVKRKWLYHWEDTPQRSGALQSSYSVHKTGCIQHHQWKFAG